MNNNNKMWGAQIKEGKKEGRKEGGKEKEMGIFLRDRRDKRDGERA